ncbi:MAG: hypothetical protein BWY99_02744 [Synergistetes bacterium ADurb.BinA166]|nr:MAG: hypothetical protein BWY99_02744 [Synergistetes bacterium ADurb.BinA166]
MSSSISWMNRMISIRFTISRSLSFRRTRNATMDLGNGRRRNMFSSFAIQASKSPMFLNVIPPVW